MRRRADRRGAAAVAHEPGAGGRRQAEQEAAPGGVHEQRGGYPPGVVGYRVRVRGVGERIRDNGAADGAHGEQCYPANMRQPPTVTIVRRLSRDSAMAPANAPTDSTSSTHRSVSKRSSMSCAV